MKWKKLGKIFEFEKSPFSKRFFSHAQSPQVMVFDDFLRIYFSTRKKDKDSFISYPQYIDYSKDFSNILSYSKGEIISRGKLGCFDEPGIFPFSPMRYQNKIYSYISGWSRRASVDVESSVGLVISEDGGETFQRIGNGPVLSSSLHEPFLIADSFVKCFDEKFYMYYIYGEKWCEATKDHAPERVYKISYALSDDGVNWKKSGKRIIPDVIDENECQALPTVIKIDSRYHMYFCYRHMIGFREEKDKGYRLGYAYSDDLINWVRDDENCGISPTPNSWDSDMMCYPNLFEMEGNVYLLYNGNNFGKTGFGLAKLVKD